jgi:hypothetical protein
MIVTLHQAVAIQHALEQYFFFSLSKPGQNKTVLSSKAAMHMLGAVLCRTAGAEI